MSEMANTDPEGIDGVRMTWNVWPRTKVEASKCVIPLAACIAPIRFHTDIPTLPYAPLRCKTCSAVLNPFSRVDFTAKIWICPFCYQRNHFPPHYKLSLAQREEMIRRTVYVSDIDQQVTEETLAALFINCCQVVDCRVCGDPNSVLRFAFIEFTDEEGAMAALSLSGTMLGYYLVRVLPSKTAIAPVNPKFLPRSDDEREMCSRTIYCTNIDKKVQRLRLLGDYHHSTRICFVEFTVGILEYENAGNLITIAYVVISLFLMVLLEEQRKGLGSKSLEEYEREGSSYGEQTKGTITGPIRVSTFGCASAASS